MKTASRLHFSRLLFGVRFILLVAVVAALVALIRDMRSRTDEPVPDGTEQSAPAKQQSHYDFPTYA